MYGCRGPPAARRDRARARGRRLYRRRDRRADPDAGIRSLRRSRHRRSAYGEPATATARPSGTGAAGQGRPRPDRRLGRRHLLPQPPDRIDPWTHAVRGRPVRRGRARQAGRLSRLEPRHERGRRDLGDRRSDGARTQPHRGARFERMGTGVVARRDPDRVLVRPERDAAGLRHGRGRLQPPTALRGVGRVPLVVPGRLGDRVRARTSVGRRRSGTPTTRSS